MTMEDQIKFKVDSINKQTDDINQLTEEMMRCLADRTPFHKTVHVANFVGTVLGNLPAALQIFGDLKPFPNTLNAAIQNCLRTCDTCCNTLATVHAEQLA